ncbi:MAG: acetyl-CoA carboxylase biotin carboxyl carrier protein [Eubacterium sp.]
MESMEMFNEILRDFNQSDLISMDVEMPGIRLSVKRESSLAGLTAESAAKWRNRKTAAFSDSALNPAENAAASRNAGSGAADDPADTAADPASGTAPSSASSTGRAGTDPAAGGTKAENPQDNTAETILCPLVGVYYSASAPDAEPFVREGQKVKEGEVMCIIEAMKSMNELKAPYNLTVKKICVNNGEMAEFHQLLFEVEKC